MLRLPPPISSFLRRLSSPTPPLSRALSSASRTPTDALAAYRRKMLGRPPTEKLSSLGWKKNSCSFIGTVLHPVKQSLCGSTYTVLEVNNPSGNYFSYPCRILLSMWDEIAEKSLHYLKPDDFVYVSGVLRLYKKVDENGDTQVYYKVVVKVLNYVKRGASDRTALDQERATSSNEPDHEMDRLRLWGVYFANPWEWSDNRKGKEYPGYPDFKHEDTGECLWIMPDDPPWIQKQLQRNDSKFGVLRPYKKDDENGDTQVYYKVVAKVPNYVKRGASDPTALDQERATSSNELDREMDRLRLWGVYFANPWEWSDNRKGKECPGDPDFKHEDTGECLWIMPDDPPWIQKQLQRNDSKFGERLSKALPDESSKV